MFVEKWRSCQLNHHIEDLSRFGRLTMGEDWCLGINRKVGKCHCLPLEIQTNFISPMEIRKSSSFRSKDFWGDFSGKYWRGIFSLDGAVRANQWRKHIWSVSCIEVNQMPQSYLFYHFSSKGSSLNLFYFEPHPIAIRARLLVIEYLKV